jgi:hypothetical protein
MTIPNELTITINELRELFTRENAVPKTSGDWTISITGHSDHHNSQHNDADAMMKRFVADLTNNGHELTGAYFESAQQSDTLPLARMAAPASQVPTLPSKPADEVAIINNPISGAPVVPAPATPPIPTPPKVGP